MRPVEMLAVFVRAAGLYLLLTALLAFIAIMVAVLASGNVALIAVAAPLIQAIAGLLIIKAADSIAALCYR
jgi:hypothetical protein